MRCLLAFALSVALAASAGGAPPAMNGDAGRRGVLSPGDVERVKDNPPRITQAALTMFGPPARAYRAKALPGVTIWEYPAATGRLEIHHKSGRVTDIFLPAGS